ncbi:hypothetical protein NP493_2121g00015 [Ridgeia piscesae]|uniref:Uncharacterized protein n=1 Tax=Ridgeia piscesae TaxID=27915 RepID=A0AAD9N345_RIDPI|nr:hypothetical protein NP493_2121g00015 [Ridgeia piscesae]
MNIPILVTPMGEYRGHCLDLNFSLVYINDLRTIVPLYKYVDDSTLFEICDRNDVSVIQESVDFGSQMEEQNDMKINSEKSKEIIISFAQDGNF